MAPKYEELEHRALDEQFADFLRTRRAALTPEAVGLRSYGQRRVPGLRREELAEVAGISPTYYTRLEQGLATHPSTQVLDALARALRLGDVERAHMFAIAGAPLTTSDETPIRPGLVALLDRMPDVPAIVLSRRQDIVGWNRLGHALLAGHLDPHAAWGQHPPNKVAMLFTDPAARALHREWEYEATLAVASLRYITGRFPADPDLAALVGELSLASADFARLWAEHPVELCSSGTKKYHHPIIGRVDLCYEAFHLPENDGSRMLLHSAVPGSPDDDALRMLASRTITN